MINLRQDREWLERMAKEDECECVSVGGFYLDNLNAFAIELRSKCGDETIGLVPDWNTGKITVECSEETRKNFPILIKGIEEGYLNDVMGEIGEGKWDTK